MRDHGAVTWAFLRRRPDYRAAWQAHAGAPEYEAAPFPVRMQSHADLAAAAPWSLLAWEDPGEIDMPAGEGPGAIDTPAEEGSGAIDGAAEEDPVAPFWHGALMLEATVSRRAPPLVPLLEEAGAAAEGLRLLDGLLVLRIARPGAAVQLLVECDRPFAAADGLRVFLDVDLGLSVRIGQLRDLWNAACCPSPRRGRVRGAGFRMC